MALRLASKINRNIIHKHLGKTLSTKTETATVTSTRCLGEEKPLAEIPHPSDVARYHVCRPRTSPLIRQAHTPPVEAESEIAKKHMEIQHLQPSMLPEYFKPNVDLNSVAPPRNQYQAFIESKTYKNVMLPLKMPKLASPFPDPVKAMTSHIVSDQEKAEQMLAESKMTKQMSSDNLTALVPKRNYSTPPSSTVGMDPEKCKKMKSKGKKSCTKMVAPGCKAPKSISCLTRPRKNIECTKKEAPYPSYSETCHEDIEVKPSECKLCPWKPEENPNFKPPKTKFHTSSAASMTLRKDKCEKPVGLDKEPCGWVKKDPKKKIKHGQSNLSNQEKDKTSNNSSPNKKGAMAFFDDEPLALNGYLCDVRKAPCKKPAPKPCGKPNPEKEEKEQKEKQKNDKKKKAGSLPANMDNWLLSTQSNPLKQFTEPPLHVTTPCLMITDEKSVGKGHCKKLPFDKCVKRKRREVVRHIGKCPPKIKKKKVQDCPPDADEKEKCKTMGVVRAAAASCLNLPVLNTSRSLNEMCLQGGSPGDTKGKGKKCPKVNLGVCKESEVEEDDPCKRKRKGRTDICPARLLERYKKKKDKPQPKKAMSILIPPSVLDPKKTPTASL